MQELFKTLYRAIVPFLKKGTLYHYLPSHNWLDFYLMFDAILGTFSAAI